MSCRHSRDSTRRSRSRSSPNLRNTSQNLRQYDGSRNYPRSDHCLSTESSSSKESSISINNESIDLNDTLDFSPVNELFTPPAKIKKSQSFSNRGDNNVCNQIEADWDVEISPIMKSRESDGGGAVLFMSSDDDPTQSAPLQFAIDKGLVEYASPKHRTMTNKKIEKQNEGNLKMSRETPHHDEDISSLRKQVGKTSNDFLEKVTEAARRRKFAMAKSRDSLVAKEEEQRRSIQIASERKSHKEVNNTSIADTDNRYVEKTSSDLNLSFKARPVPSTTGEKGTGGLKGVPKVEKRPTTTPLSPLLGCRRQQNPKPFQNAKTATNYKVEDKMAARKSVEVDTSTSFSAKGFGGVQGVPKVGKRPITTPLSPLLGHRRSRKEKLEALQTSQRSMATKRGRIGTSKPVRMDLSTSFNAKGIAGVQGVPKVQKRPTTTPLSPLLGFRRPQNPKVEALKPPKEGVSIKSSGIPGNRKQAMVASASFKAHSLPASLGTKGNRGQISVSEVFNRQLTIPRSPNLGPRRRSRSADLENTTKLRCDTGNSKQNHLKDAMSTSRSNSMSSLPSTGAPRDGGSCETDGVIENNSPGGLLYGLKLLADTPDHYNGKVENDENTSPQTTWPFELHSTRRAKKRSEYNASRDDNLKSRAIQEKIEREKQIRHMEKELKILRGAL